jgi:TDG/mug DNA glycosylase family protein
MPACPAEGSLPDLIEEGIELLFVGINPGLTSARLGHYYAGPGNLFWRCLHESGLTPERLRPQEDRRLLQYRIGITDCVKRASRTASEVRASEFRDAAAALIEKIERARPRLVCFNGLMGYRATIDREARLGLQPRPLGGATVFVVPSTSAANAGFTREERVEWFRRLRELRDVLRAAETPPETGPGPGKEAARPADILNAGWEGNGRG